jgi:hypothetical protein
MRDVLGFAGLGVLAAGLTMANVATADDGRVCGFSTAYYSSQKISEQVKKECQQGDVLFIMKMDVTDHEPLSEELPSFICDFNRQILIDLRGKYLSCIYRGTVRAERK